METCIFFPYSRDEFDRLGGGSYLFFHIKPPASALAVSLSATLFLLFSALILSKKEQPLSPEMVRETMISAGTEKRYSSESEQARDSDGILANGKLRILVPQGESIANISSSEADLLSRFAQAENLIHEWIIVEDQSTMLTRLEEGEGDVIALMSRSNSAEGQDGILHTLPWGVSRQQLIGRAGGINTMSLADLAVRQVALKRTSPAWSILSGLNNENSGMELLLIPENTDIKTILKKVASGHYDLAVVDSMALPADLEFHYQLGVVMDLTEDRYMTWGVNENAESLQQALNNFLNKRHLELEADRVYREDMPTIKQRRQLRLITYQSTVNYYYNRGRFRGFEYELINKFAEDRGLRLDVVVASSWQEMQDMLETGKGDIIAASIPESIAAKETTLGLSRPYNYAVPVLVGRLNETLVDFRDLEGRTIMLSTESPYREILERIRSQGINFTILTADTNLNAEEVLFGVAQGVYDLGVLGSHEVNAEFSRQLNLKAHFNLTDPEALVWAVRKSSPLLLSELDEFIKAEYRKGFYNVVYARYIENPDAVVANTRLFTQLDQLSPYDEIVHKFADLYSFDWRLIVAQMYQESRFNPYAVSTAGAEGLMQLLPDTAKSIGITELRDPHENIYGGIVYLDYLRNLFEEDLALEDRTWFTLASYNAGYARVRRARKLAADMGLDENRWFDNVEIAMLRLARPYERDGEVLRNCRCGQAVVYVREIKALYNNYLQLTRSVRTVSAPGQEPDKI